MNQIRRSHASFLPPAALSALAPLLLLACAAERPYEEWAEASGPLGPDGAAASDPEESTPVAFELAPSEPDGKLRKGFLSGIFGPAGEVADEAQLFDITPQHHGERHGFRLEATVPGETADADAMLIFDLADGELEDLGGPGSRHDIRREGPVRVWLCAVGPGGDLVFDDTQTTGSLEVRDGGAGQLEVAMHATGGLGASGDLVFWYEPDLERLAGAE